MTDLRPEVVTFSTFFFFIAKTSGTYLGQVGSNEILWYISTCTVLWIDSRATSLLYMPSLLLLPHPKMFLQE